MASFVGRFSWGCEPTRRRKTSFANKGARFHCTGILKRQTRLDIDPEELRRLLDKTRAEWYEDANTAPLPIHFPAEVRTKLENIFGPHPSWDLIKAAFRRVYSDKQLEKTFIVDLERLYYHEDSFSVAA